MGVCVQNFSSVSFFVWPGHVTQLNTQTHKYTHIQVKLGISSTGCSPHDDFDNKKMNINIKYEFPRQMVSTYAVLARVGSRRRVYVGGLW